MYEVELGQPVDPERQIKYLNNQLNFLEKVRGRYPAHANPDMKMWWEVEKWKYSVAPFIAANFPNMGKYFEELTRFPVPNDISRMNGVSQEAVGRAHSRLVIFLENLRNDVERSSGRYIQYWNDPLAAKDREELLGIKSALDPEGEYKGISSSTLRLFHRIRELNEHPAQPILVLGPSGSGKSHLAKVIHKSRGGIADQFHGESSTESEGDFAWALGRFIGYGKKSAVAGIPPEGRKGVLDRCKGGTLFIDEIADSRPELQLFLFKVIDGEPIHSPYGEGKTVTPKIGLIVATNQALELAVKYGRLKHDFLRRLEGRELWIPPLSKRKLDALEMLKQLIPPGAKKPRYDDRFLLALLRYDWPGNMREFIRAIENALAKEKYNDSQKRLGLADLRLSDPKIAESIENLEKSEVHAELYGRMIAMYRDLGFEKQKGLNQAIATSLGISDTKVSADLNKSGEGAARVAQRELEKRS